MFRIAATISETIKIKLGSKCKEMMRGDTHHDIRLDCPDNNLPASRQVQNV